MIRIASLVLCLGVASIAAMAQQTPPIAPKTVETPVPAPPVFPTAPAPADVPDRPLTADEAARIAVVHSPTIEQAIQAVESAKGATMQVHSAELPQVTVNAGYTDVISLNAVNGQSSSAVQTFPGYTGTAELKQLLFDFNHTRELVRQSKLLEDVARDNLTKTRYDLVLATKQAYYQYANNVRALQISESSLQNRQKQLALANAQLSVGLGLPSDVALAETTVAQAVTALSVARSNASTSRISLALIMGIDPRTPIAVTQADEPPPATYDMNALVDTALKQRPDMKSAADNLSSFTHGLKAARTTNAPIVSGLVGVGTSGSSLPTTNDALSLGISLSWNAFDGGFTAGKVKQAKAEQAIAASQQLGTKLMVISDVAQAFATLKNDEQRVASAKNSVINGTEGVRIATGRFSSGLGIFLDIITAETALESAESDLTQATLSVDQDRAALAHAIGSPIPTSP